MTRLVEANLVAPDWADDEHKGMVSNSVVVLAVRKGNPKGIKGWDDLVRDDVEVITPNPFTSGGARWNVMAAYGAQLRQGKSKDEAVEYLRKLFHNVAVQDKSARESLQTFAGGKGDVLIAYENEAITAQQKGEELDYVIPDETILIENPIAVVSESKHPEQAQAFIDYARSRAGTEGLRREGLPVDPARPRRRRAVSQAEGDVHDRRARRLGEGHGGLLRPRGRGHGRHPARARGSGSSEHARRRSTPRRPAPAAAEA